MQPEGKGREGRGGEGRGGEGERGDREEGEERGERGEDNGEAWGRKERMGRGGGERGE